MLTMYEIEQWRQHHDELLREAENGRLARQLRPAREVFSGQGYAAGWRAPLVPAQERGGGMLKDVRRDNGRGLSNGLRREPGAGIRMVPAPGGVAFVKDESTTAMTRAKGNPLRARFATVREGSR